MWSRQIDQLREWLEFLEDNCERILEGDILKYMEGLTLLYRTYEIMEQKIVNKTLDDEFWDILDKSVTLYIMEGALIEYEKSKIGLPPDPSA